MPANHGVPYLNELMVSTREQIATDGLLDQVLRRRPYLDALKAKAKSHTGLFLRVNLESADDESTVLTDSSGTFSTAVSGDIMGAADWQYSAPLVGKLRLKWEDIERNSGSETQLVKLVATHMEAVEKGHARRIDQLAHWTVGTPGATVTGPTGAPVVLDSRGLIPGAFDSLDFLVSDVSQAGGIDPTQATFWKSTRLYLSKAAVPSIRVAMRTVMNEIYDVGGARPNLIIAGGDVYDEYENTLDEQIRFTSLGVAETRFSELRFDGIVVRRDPSCQPDRMYFLTDTSLEFGPLNDNLMKVQDTQKIVGTLDTVTPIVSKLLHGVTSRRDHGLLIRGDEPSGRNA